jgi:hypothetical protein
MDWRYQLDQIVSKELPALANIEFANRWLTIVNGVVTISQKYSWNGILPASLNFLVNFFGWFTFATKDATEKTPITYIASLVYDALCQYRASIPIEKKEALIPPERARRTCLESGDLQCDLSHHYPR